MNSWAPATASRWSGSCMCAWVAQRGHGVTLDDPRALVLLLTRSFPPGVVLDEVARADVLPFNCR